MSLDAILELDQDNFDERIRREEQPILVDFWTNWCQSCKKVAPVLEELAEEYDGRASIVKVDVEENGDLGNRFGIRSVPTLMLFKSGRVVDQLVGAAPKATIRDLIERQLDD